MTTDKLWVRASISLDVDELDEMTIETVSSKIKALALEHQGHRFGAHYVDGACEVSVIAVDMQLCVTPLKALMYRVGSDRHYSIFARKANVEEVVAATHGVDGVLPETEKEKNAALYIAKFANLECVLVMPSSFTKHPKLLAALGLESLRGTKGAVSLMSLNATRFTRLREFSAKSVRLAYAKYKYLFPTLPFEKPKPKKTKSPLSPKRPAPPGPIDTDDTNASKLRRVDSAPVQERALQAPHIAPAAGPSIPVLLMTQAGLMVAKAAVTTTGAGSAPGTGTDKMLADLEARIKAEYKSQGRAKYAAYHVAKNFIDILGEVEDVDLSAKLGFLNVLPAAIALDMLGNVDVCKSIIAYGVPGGETSTRLVSHIETIGAAMATLR